MAETLHIDLHSPWREAAEARQVNIFNRLAAALPGWTLAFHPDNPAELSRAARRGWGLFHMQEPTGPRILSLRKAYHFPFWRIEATNERWRFDIALAGFDPAAVPRAEAAALDGLCRRFPRFQLVQADAKDLLAACDAVVTQNSAVALTGYFAGKRAVLFGGIDFHHIAGSVPRDGLAAAFAALQGPEPDFEGYLWWFFRHATINGGAPEAEAQMQARFRRHGWPV